MADFNDICLHQFVEFNVSNVFPNNLNEFASLHTFIANQKRNLHNFVKHFEQNQSEVEFYVSPLHAFAICSNKIIGI